jgi:hypothetical protein
VPEAPAAGAAPLSGGASDAVERAAALARAWVPDDAPAAP